MTELLTPDEVARRTGRARGTLAQWRFQGNGPPFVKLGARVMYPADEFQKWIDALPRHRSTAECT
ncbi:MAG TPA: helix-turn-helix domain-containing protein [Gemmatimonadaceae bacterium]|nr:helix-turn-helix domain-containing protein [Gemmatimonadaceae bacterium]